MTYRAKEVYKQDKIAEEYDLKRFTSFKGRLVDKMEKELVNRAIKMAQVVPPAKILDLPCGTGRLTRFLAEKGYQVTGVDISQAMIKQSEKNIKNSSIEQLVHFFIGDAESLFFQDSFFDIGVSLRLFGHLPMANRLSVLKELSRISKSYIIVAYYHKNSFQNFMRKYMRAQKKIPWYPVDLRQISEELASANLKIVKKFFIFPCISETVVILARKQTVQI